MASEEQRYNQDSSREWDSQDSSGIDQNIDDHDVTRDAETGAVIGVIGGAVVGALAGGPVGAVVGGVLGGIGGGAGVAAVDRFAHPEDYVDDDESVNQHPDLRESVGPYPGDMGKSQATQFNGVGIYDTGYPGSKEIESSPQEDWHAEPDGSTIFRLPGYQNAEQVSVAATFNNWSTTANPMRYLDGTWITEIDLPPGKHQYRFVVDGSWIPDPTNPEKVDDGGGNVNSVIIVERDIVNPGAILDQPRSIY